MIKLLHSSGRSGSRPRHSTVMIGLRTRTALSLRHQQKHLAWYTTIHSAHYSQSINTSSVYTSNLNFSTNSNHRSSNAHLSAPSTSYTPSLQRSSAHGSPLGGALGDLHKRSWNAQHVQGLVQQCGMDKAKWRNSLTALAKQGKSVHLKAALDRMRLLGLPVQGSHIRLLLDSCLASRNPALACQYLEQCCGSGSSSGGGDPMAPALHPALFLHALKICGIVGDPVTSAQLLDLMQQQQRQAGGGEERGLPSAALTAHMHAFATAGDLSGALSVLGVMHPSSSSSPPSSFSRPLLDTEATLLQLPHCDILLSDYNILLKACASANSADFHTAQRLFQHLVARDLTPNSHTWSAVIQAAARAGHPDEGLDLLRAMVQQHQHQHQSEGELTPHSFNHLLTAYSKIGNTEQFQEVFSLMMAAAVPLDDYSYSILFASVSNGVLTEDCDVFRKFFAQRTTAPASASAPTSCLSPLTAPYEALMEGLVVHMLMPREEEEGGEGVALVLPNHCWRVASAPYCKDLNYAGLERLVVCISSFDPQQQQQQQQHGRQVTQAAGSSTDNSSISTDSPPSRSQWSGKKGVRAGNGRGKGEGAFTVEYVGGARQVQAAAWHQLQLSMLRDSIGCLGKLGRADEAYQLLKTFQGAEWSSSHSASASGHQEDIQNCWQRVIRAYAEGQHDWRRAVEVLDEMRAQGLQMSPRLWRHVLQSAARESMETLVQVLRLSYVNDGFLPDEEGWGLLVSVLDKSSLYRSCSGTGTEGSEEEDDDDRQSSFEHEAFILKDFIDACPEPVQKYIVASVVRYLDSNSSYSPQHIRMFLSDYERLFVAFRNKKGKSFLAAVKEVGKYPTKLPEWSLADILRDRTAGVSTATATVSGDGFKTEDAAGAVSLSRPSTTFLSRLKAKALAEDLQGCFAVYDELLDYLSEHSLHHTSECGDEIITTDFFDILLSMSVKHNFREEEAVSIFQLLVDMRIRPSTAVYWHMLKAYASTGDLVGAMDIAEHCRRIHQQGAVAGAATVAPARLGEDTAVKVVCSPPPSPTLEAIFAKVIRMISAQRGGGGGSIAAIAYIESLFEKDIKTSRLYAALITEHLKLDQVSDALHTVELLLSEPNADLHEVNRFIDIAYMTVLNSIIKSNNLAYYEKGRIVDRFIKKLVNKQVKTLSTFSLYTDYLIKDRNDIYVYIDMLNEMSSFFGQDACNIWENLLRKCASQGMHEEAVWILDRMYESEAVRPSCECLALVSQALCASGHHSEAMDMLQRMGLEFRALHSSSHLPSRYWHPLLDSLHQSGQHARLLQALDAMRAGHVAPDKHCALRAVQACLARGQHDEAIRITQDMCAGSSRWRGARSRDSDRDGDSGGDDVDAADKNNHGCENTGAPAAMRVMPGLDIYKPLLVYLAANDLPEEVIGVIEQMDATGVSLDSDTWVCVERMRRFDIVLETFERNNCSTDRS